MATQPAENIEAVLGRFQAWAGTRNAVEARPGIREIPYEEALASGRYRWKGAGANSARKPDMKAAPRPEAAPVRADSRKKQQPPKKVRTREHGKAAGDTKVAAGKLGPENKGGGENHCAAVKAAAPGRGSAARPAFREVLAEAVRPAEVIVAAQPVELTRQVAISIRLAPSERALIKTRAAEAGITASAYVRQCALEVEQLRAQVRSAVAAMERGGGFHVSAASVSTPAPVPPPGFFARTFRRFFPGSAPALALRA